MISNTPLVFATRIGLTLFTIFIVLLHMLQPEVTFLYDAMSYYVHGPGGWLLPASLTALGLGSLTLSLELVRRTRGKLGYAGITCLALWGISLLIAAVFPTDPIGSWDKLPSTSGMIHFAAAIVSFIFLVIAVTLLTRKLGNDPRWSTVKKSMVWLAGLTAVSFLLLMVSIVSIFASSGAPLYFGLTERLFIFIGAGWIGLAAAGLRQGS
ncbi:hypothetical protein PCCS19_19810 [Paenibacillus sp. CCS19]|uniref:DUF998 domain-containing protein n=1 Tax=Paenibacillus sp. CCS19 TaxID=3158387 RepID=UPI0025625C9A|nr:DUF998 domain-containing protein [Paenibacillus cellulosilyticus]GMK38927.1 hypothetical protein PCCS19_19810 [Paenibacillus cellulosilyticus]